MDRHSGLGKYGIVTLHFTPRRLREDPAFVIDTIRKAINAGSARPRLGIRTVPAPNPDTSPAPGPGTGPARHAV